MLERCVFLAVLLWKLILELGLEGPTEDDRSGAQLLKLFQVVTDYLQGQIVPKDVTADLIFEQAKTTTI